MAICLDTQKSAPKRPPLGMTVRNAAAVVWPLVLRTCKAARHGVTGLGVVTLAAALLLATQPSLRDAVDHALGAWLPDAAALDDEAVGPTTPAERVVSTDAQALPQEQARVTEWLARKYRVAAEPLGALVAEAYRLGPQLRLEPTLLLAVMAIESRFNPFAASPWGAHGLMQVHTRAHEDKFEPHGGPLAAFDPLSNLRVGAEILHDAVRRAGSIPGGLRLYVGAVTTDGRDYIVKVLAEQERLKRVSGGQRVAFQASVPLPFDIDALLAPALGGSDAPAAPDATSP
ncbi:transglycosylase SLT domain-containing protein, partial [Tepidimonas thermarum]|uniref:transglycosylase SLT domain-containing protein n=1 Tax=Tepidimonas thermarum TaxID=335431 RepID=UPI001FE91CD1